MLERIKPVDASLPIPIEPNDLIGWKEVQISESREPLVPLGPFTDYNLLAQDSIYFGERTTSPYQNSRLEGILITPFVREGLARRLQKAEDLLPEGHIFLIWDAYRTVEVQRALFDHYRLRLSKQRSDLSDEELIQEAQRFVSLPSVDPLKPSPHNTGGVVDLTIVKLPVMVWREITKSQNLKNTDWQTVYRREMEKMKLVREFGQPLDMGTPFDYVGAETATNYYEHLAQKRSLTLDEKVILSNRRLLFNSLRAVGVLNYPEEWWHYSYGDQMCGRQRQISAIYGPAQMSPENYVWERMRRLHYLGNVRIHLFQSDYSEMESVNPVLQFVVETAKDSGDPRYSKHPEAVQI